jgi:hypothetical protein
VVEGEGELKHFISHNYKSLFMSSAGADDAELLNKVPRLVTSEMNAYLSKEFRHDDIIAALNSMGDLKAPRPDGMPAIFYKRFWNLICSKV